MIGWKWRHRALIFLVTATSGGLIIKNKRKMTRWSTYHFWGIKILRQILIFQEFWKIRTLRHFQKNTLSQNFQLPKRCTFLLQWGSPYFVIPEPRNRAKWGAQHTMHSWLYQESENSGIESWMQSIFPLFWNFKNGKSYKIRGTLTQKGFKN